MKSVNSVLIYFRTTSPLLLSHYQSPYLSFTAIQFYVGTVLLELSIYHLKMETIGASVPQETEGHPLGEKEDPVKGEQQPVDPGPGPRKRAAAG